MNSNKTKKQKTENLRTKHILAIAAALCGAFLMAFTDDWSSYICIFCALIAANSDRKYEAEDELSKENMYRANTVVMWVLIATMVVLAGYNKWQDIGYVVYLCDACVAIALRSALFLWFDRTPKEDTEDE
ncbi:MAG: hypothetical protein Q4E74_00565 [Ruminococcus sp.]|nr:hypothetical protein [Ruminococcus sp.]